MKKLLLLIGFASLTMNAQTNPHLKKNVTKSIIKHISSYSSYFCPNDTANMNDYIYSNDYLQCEKDKDTFSIVIKGNNIVIVNNKTKDKGVNSDLILDNSNKDFDIYSSINESSFTTTKFYVSKDKKKIIEQFYSSSTYSQFKNTYIQN